MSTVSNSTSAATSSILNNGNTTASSSSSSAPATQTDSLANSQTFLTLLVAQLKNQDPTQPADGMQFVTQLAQFSGLEQSVAMRTDIDAIKNKYVSSTTDQTTSTAAATNA